MKLTAQMFQEIIKSIISERKWNKDSNTPRDYSKEYNPPGSKEQDERNKRKRDKRKHDKEHGECSDNQDLHHVDGIESDKVKCEPPYINRGRKEKSRLKKSKAMIKIEEHQLRKIIQEEAKIVLKESDIDKISSVAGSQGISKPINQQGTGAVQDPSPAPKARVAAAANATTLERAKAKAAARAKAKAKASERAKAKVEPKIDDEFAELITEPIDDLGSGSSVRAEAKK